MTEGPEDLVTFKITNKAKEWAEDEQRRIGRERGSKVTQAELFDLLRSTYQQEDHAQEAPPLKPKLQVYVDKLIEILTSGDSLAIDSATRHIDLLRDRLKPAGRK